MRPLSGHSFYCINTRINCNLKIFNLRNSFIWSLFLFLSLIGFLEVTKIEIICIKSGGKERYSFDLEECDTLDCEGRRNSVSSYQSLSQEVLGY